MKKNYTVVITMKSGYTKAVVVRATTEEDAILKAKRNNAVHSTRMNPLISVMVIQAI